LLSADGVAVQRIDHWIVAGLLSGVAGRKKHNHVTVDRVTFQIAFQGSAVNLDALHRDQLRSGNDWGRFRLNLRRRGRRQSHD